MTRKIRNYDDLALTRQQLTRAENALVHLHKDVYAKNPRNYAIYAEGPIDMILQLRAEIDAFLHIAPAPPESQPSDDNGTAPGGSIGQDASTEAMSGTPASTS
jgi:hypothetical protein